MLRLYVSQIRRLLPPGPAVRARPGYMLVVEPGELDADAFEHLLADGRQALPGQTRAWPRSLHERALGLWRGDALADLADEPFARDEAARLERAAAGVQRGAAGCRARARAARGGDRRARAARRRASAARAAARAADARAVPRGRQADALACYRAGRELLVAELGLEPGAELRELERRILRQDPRSNRGRQALRARGASAFRRPPTVTLGRTGEIAAVRRLLLASSTRLVTLVGPGGIGKTRLAVEVGATASGAEFADGAVFVELAPVRDPSCSSDRSASALGLRETRRCVVAEPARASTSRPLELLLVLDNLEHLSTATAPLAALLAAAPRLKVLATSRTVLRLSAEHVCRVPPLEPEAALELLVRQRDRRRRARGVDRCASRGAAAGLRAPRGLPARDRAGGPWLRSLPPTSC